MKETILGIDLGTTNSCMSIIEGGKPKILENAEGQRTTPSIIAENKAGERVVGLPAKRQAVTNHKNTLFSVKRLIGRRWEDKEVQREKDLLPYEIVKSGVGVKVKMGDKEFTPQEIAAMVLAKMKADAEAKTGDTITEAVITVPAYFDDAQRQATKEAGEIAGLKVARIINEPTAAALAYGFDKQKGEKVAVYDLGGGTFDISILEVDENTVEVKATNGDTHLGGDDFDKAIINWIIDEFKKDKGKDLSKDDLALQRIKEAAEKAKIELSSAGETEINQPFITQDADGTPLHLVLKMTRAKLEDLVAELVRNSLDPVEKALKDAGFAKGEIDQIIMVGGMTRMPLVQAEVEKFFGKKTNVSVNPDEVVASGAAVQAGVLQGEVKDVLLLDVTPLTLGIETMGGVSTALIERNTTIPTSKSQIFSTAAENQPSVEIHVLQGERSMSGDNKTLGRFMLDGIPPAPRGVPQIEVSFDIDANGILNVSAKDKGTGKEQKITITASTGLSDEEIKKMTEDAEAHAEEDKKKKDAVETRNNAETIIATTDKMMKESGDKIGEDDKKEIEAKVAELKTALEADNLEDMKAKMEELSQVAQKIGAAMYQQQGAAGAPEGAAEPVKEKVVDGGPEDVIEGEVVK